MCDDCNAFFQSQIFQEAVIREMDFGKEPRMRWPWTNIFAETISHYISLNKSNIRRRESRQWYCFLEPFSAVLEINSIHFLAASLADSIYIVAVGTFVLWSTECVCVSFARWALFKSENQKAAANFFTQSHNVSFSRKKKKKRTKNNLKVLLEVVCVCARLCTGVEVK